MLIPQCFHSIYTLHQAKNHLKANQQRSYGGDLAFNIAHLHAQTALRECVEKKFGFTSSERGTIALLVGPLAFRIGSVWTPRVFRSQRLLIQALPNCDKVFGCITSLLGRHRVIITNRSHLEWPRRTIEAVAVKICARPFVPSAQAGNGPVGAYPSRYVVGADPFV
jgi:hypothetical protein